MNLYPEIREQMRTGDLIEWSPASTIGWMIRKFTGKDVSHTSLVIRSTFPGLEEHVFILEAVRNGIVPARLSFKLVDFVGLAYWLPLKPEFNRYRAAAGAWAIQTFVDQKPEYDFPGLFSNILGRVSLDGQLYYCSEWAQMAWTKAKIIPEMRFAVRPGEFEELGVTLPRVKIFEV